MTPLLDLLLNLSIILLSASIVLILLSSIKGSKQRGTPLPRLRGWPLIGNAFDFVLEKRLETMARASRLLGPIFEAYIFSTRVIVTSDPIIIKEVMGQRPKVFRRLGSLQESALALSGRQSHSLLHEEGEDWSRLRRLIAPAFSSKNIGLKTSDIVDEALKMVERLRKRMASASSQPVTLMMNKEAQHTAIRLISRIAFGGENGADVDYFYSQEFMNDIRNEFRFNAEKMLSPYHSLVWRWTAKYVMELKAKTSYETQRFHCLNVINERRKAMLNQPIDADKSSGNILDVLIQRSEDDQSVAPITDLELLDNVKILYAAGSETTSIAISWALYYTSLNHEVREKIRRETDHYFATDEAFQELLNLKDVPGTFKYTHAVIKEVLRLGAPASLLPAELVSEKESVTLSNGVVINPGDQFFVNIDSCLRNENVYKNPNEFNPNRWLTEDPDALLAMEANFLTFGAGRRICPGMGLAHVEAIIALIVLLHHFDFDLACKPQDVKRELQFTTQCVNLQMFVKPREIPSLA